MQRKKLIQSGSRLTAYEFFHRMISWLECYFTNTGLIYHAHRLLKKSFTILETRGKLEAIKYVKGVRAHLIEVLSKLSPLELSSKEKLRRVVFHKDIRFLKQYLPSKGYPLLRLILSTLYCLRFLRGSGEPSFSTIESGPIFDRTPIELKEKILPFLVSLGLNPKYLGFKPRRLDFKAFHMTTKSGPQGHALWSSYRDLETIPSDLRKSLELLGGKRFEEDMSNYLKFIPYIRDYLDRARGETQCSFRRLTTIRDKEGKTREVAILDYYSQAALRPLHNYLFDILKRIPQDSTFNQGRDIGILKPTKGSQFHSIDLSNATDRFPIVLQFDILSTMFGKEYAEAWRHVMVGYPFDYKDRKVTYVRGNPMGAYSSWSAFALAHHFLVFLACERAKISWERCPYMMLGDDIVIADDKVAFHYKELLQRLDIPYSKEKSHSSFYLYEFAKRFIHGDTEITPFPLAGLYENRNSWLLAMGTIFEEVYRKRWNCLTDIPKLCLGYLQYIGYSSSFRTRKGPWIELILLIRMAFAQKGTMASAIEHAAFILHGKEFRDILKGPENWFYHSEIILKALMNSFKSSLSQVTSKKNKKPLGLIAEELTCKATELFGIVEDPFLLIRACPVLQVYGQIEEVYLKLLKNPYNDEALTSGRIREYLMAVSLPASDESFYMRRKDYIQVISAKLADQLLNVMKPLKGNLAQVHPMAW
jgi:hypothetical protein